MCRLFKMTTRNEHLEYLKKNAYRIINGLLMTQ